MQHWRLKIIHPKQEKDMDKKLPEVKKYMDTKIPELKNMDKKSTRTR